MEKRKNIVTVCIVGRPNVGKSSLFNCLFKKRRAVVVEQSGTTRDRVEAIITINSLKIKLVDTGGYLAEDNDELSLQVKDQICRAMEEASLILFVTDCVSGVVPSDKEIAVLLRKFNKPVIVAANKIDNDKLADDAVEFFQLGFGKPEEISCLHRRGIRTLRERLFAELKDEEDGEEYLDASDEKEPLKIAVVGRPNVGKSSFVNNLLERNRVIVSDIPGTTRDSIDTSFIYEEDEYLLIDTAGMRHKRKIKEPVDVFSIMRSKESIKRADIIVLLLDAASGVTKDDLSIIDFIEENGKACLILVNKWDLAEETEDVTKDIYRERLIYAANRLSKFPIEFISAKTGKNVISSLSIIKVLNLNLDLRVSTPFLNAIFKKNSPSKVPVPRRKKRPNFLYIVQSSQRPVEFKFFVNDPSSVLPSHLNYIENKLRENLPITGIPIKVFMRKSRKERR
ncbi:MAG: ribosome biogenesis GTPase Der [Candidatus Omnitrophota bacterium]|nr:ribosome biogenesis GTPase Der [Candidatus Omnitrophota bacterium]